MILTVASAWPSVWGCSVVDIRILTPNAFWRATQNFTVNHGSRSDIILEGNPWYQNTSYRNSSAVSFLLAVLYVVINIAINIAILVRWLIIIKIILWSDIDSGNGPKKSISIDFQAREGIDKGCNLLIGGWFADFVCW